MKGSSQKEFELKEVRNFHATPVTRRNPSVLPWRCLAVESAHDFQLVTAEHTAITGAVPAPRATRQRHELLRRELRTIVVTSALRHCSVSVLSVYHLLPLITNL